MAHTLCLRNQLVSFVILTGLTASFSVAAYDPLDCLADISKADPNIIIGLATKLCSATWSPEPVKCYINVPDADKEIPRGIAIDLCAGSIDAKKTVDCYEKAWSTGLNRGLSTTLCGARKQGS